ncbi:sigma-70 family RNA polymerase sigma factor [soil metagenome]
MAEATQRQRKALSDAREDDRADLLDALAARASGGDLEALDLLLWAADELGLARRAVRKVLLVEDDVDDVVQDVLIAVAEGIDGFRGEARFTTWLHGIGRFKAIAHIRRRRDEAPLPDELQGDAARISSVLVTRATVRDLVAQLPDAYREVVELRDLQQLPYAEVAERLDLNEHTVRTRAARGRALAAALLRAEDGT